MKESGRRVHNFHFPLHDSRWQSVAMLGFWSRQPLHAEHSHHPAMSHAPLVSILSSLPTDVSSLTRQACMQVLASCACCMLPLLERQDGHGALLPDAKVVSQLLRRPAAAARRGRGGRVGARVQAMHVQTACPAPPHSAAQLPRRPASTAPQLQSTSCADLSWLRRRHTHHLLGRTRAQLPSSPDKLLPHRPAPVGQVAAK